MLAEVQGHLRLELRITNPAPHGFASHGAEGQRKLFLQPCSPASPRAAVAVAPSWPSPVPFAHQQWGLLVVEEEDEEGWRLRAPGATVGAALGLGHAWPSSACLDPGGDRDVHVSLPGMEMCECPCWSCPGLG